MTLPTPRLLIAAIGLAFLATVPGVAADDIPDLRGTWSGTYLAVSPSRENEPGPRYNRAELVLDIKDQSDNVFWGTSQWRVMGREQWNEAEITGSISLHDTGQIRILERSADPQAGTVGQFDATLLDGQLYVDFRGLRAGTVYSTVLEKSATSQ